MIADKNANIFDSFKKSSDLIDRVNSFNISFQTWKRSLIDTETEVNDFHHKTPVLFLKVLIKEIRDIFNLDSLPVLLAMMVLDLHGIPIKEDDSFDSHRNDNIETLFNFYSKTQDDVFGRHRTSSPTLLSCTQKSLKMEYSGYKNYAAQLKINFKQKLASEEAKIKASILQTSAKKYKSCHAVTELEQGLGNIKKDGIPCKSRICFER